MRDGPDIVRLGMRESYRRALLFVAAPLVLAYVPLDYHTRAGREFQTLLAARLGWALLLLGIALAHPRVGPEIWRRLLLLGAGSSGAFYVAIVHLAGGLGSPQAIWLPVMPLATALLAWEHYGAVALGALTVLAGTLGLGWLEGLDPASVAIWIGLVTGTGSLGLATSVAFWLLTRSEALALAARDDAAARLARSEQQRLRAERLASTGRLAASVAHEIMSPLAAVKSDLVLLRAESRGLADLPDAREALENSLEAVDRIARIVGALRFFAAEDQAPGPHSCAVAAAVERASRTVAALLPPGVTVRCDVAPALGLVGIGEGLLAQSLVGLMLGAGSTLGRRSVGPSPEIALVARPEGAGVGIEILDDGPGLPDDALRPPRGSGGAARFPQGGAGLGLAMARELVEHAGGRVAASNRPEGGARVQLWLPPPGSQAASPPTA